jgi:hypothetical protein
VVFVAEDVDKAWSEIGPYLFHDSSTYSAWNPGDERTAMISHARSIEEPRSTSAGYRVMSVEQASEYVRGGNVLNLVPLCGGLPPEAAWPYLERAAGIVGATSSPVRGEFSVGL